MSVASIPSRSEVTTAEVPLYRLSVAQYDAMASAGILWPDCPVELLEGLLVEKREHLRADDPIVEGEQLPIYRMHVDDYLAMHEHRVITDESPVELLEGLLVQTMVRRPPHDTALGLVQDAIIAMLPPGWIVRVQSALQLTDSVPEPDLAIVRGDRRDFAGRHPTNADCGLVIEIADATLATDRGLKRRTYARHSITEYWIVNLTDGVVEACTEPTGLIGQPEYHEIRTYLPGEFIPFKLDGSDIGAIPVTQLLP
jgi:Uma2 family endonuclease